MCSVNDQQVRGVSALKAADLHSVQEPNKANRSAVPAGHALYVELQAFWKLQTNWTPAELKSWTSATFTVRTHLVHHLNPLLPKFFVDSSRSIRALRYGPVNCAQFEPKCAKACALHVWLIHCGILLSLQSEQISKRNILLDSERICSLREPSLTKAERLARVYALDQSS